MSNSTLQVYCEGSKKYGLESSKELKCQPTSNLPLDSTLFCLKFASYSEFEKREASFVGKWPTDKAQRPIDMATAGFFCKTSAEPGKDHVYCFSCGIGLYGWDPQDSPWEEHAKWKPDCQYLLRTKGQDFIDKVQNQVLSEKRNTGAHSESRCACFSQLGTSKPQTSCQQCSKPKHKRIANDIIKKFSVSQKFQRPTESDLYENSHRGNQSRNSTSKQIKLKPHAAAVGKTSTEKRTTYFGSNQSTTPDTCRFPYCEDYDMRLDTFESKWMSPIKKEKMAEAGFLYTGVKDHVKCFCCGIGLQNWIESDDPWTEHARLFPSCRYVRNVKGSRFIINIINALNPNDLETDAVPIIDDNDVDIDANEEQADNSMNIAMAGVQIVNHSPPETEEDVLDDPFRLAAAQHLVEKEGRLPTKVKQAVLDIIRNHKKEKQMNECTTMDRHADPKFLHHQTKERRLETFSQGAGTHHNPQLLAEAGFYHTNTKESMRCFFCGIELNEIKEIDDPFLHMPSRTHHVNTSDR